MILQAVVGGFVLDALFGSGSGGASSAENDAA